MPSRSKRQQERLKQRREAKERRKKAYEAKAVFEKKRTDAKRKLVKAQDHPNGPCGNVGCSDPQCRWRGESLKSFPCGIGASTPSEIAMAHRGYKMPTGSRAEQYRLERAIARRAKRRHAA